MEKIKQTPFKASIFKIHRFLELVHIDLCEALETHALGESQYMIVFTDNYIINHKTEVFDNSSHGSNILK